MWQHEHNCGTRQVLSLTLELCLLSVVMWGGQRPGIITVSCTHNSNKLHRRYSGASILPLFPRAQFFCFFTFLLPRSLKCNLYPFSLQNAFHLKKKKEDPSKQKHTMSLKSSYSCCNAVQLITCRCSLPTLGWCTLKHTSCLHGFIVLHGIIVPIEVCISLFPGFSNSKLEINTQKIKVCQALWTDFFSVGSIMSISRY